MQKYWNMEDMCGLGAAWASIRWYISFRLHFPPSHQNVSFYPTNASTQFKIHGSQTTQNLSRFQNKWQRFREVCRISLFLAINHDFDHTLQNDQIQNCWPDFTILTHFRNLDLKWSLLKFHQVFGEKVFVVCEEVTSGVCYIKVIF